MRACLLDAMGGLWGGGGGHEFNTGFVDKGFRQCMTAGVSLKLVGLGGHTMSGLVPFLYAVDCSVKQWAATW